MKTAIFLKTLGNVRGLAIRDSARREVMLASGIMLVLAALLATAAERELCGEKVASVQALEGVIKAKPGVKIVPSAAAYVSYNDPATKYIWNFATRTNPAFPSVACRRWVDVAGQQRIATDIVCEAGREACDQEAAGYLQLDRQMSDAISGSGTR